MVANKKLVGKNWQRIWFNCSKCGEKTWTEVDLTTYVFTVADLVCADCVEAI